MERLCTFSSRFNTFNKFRFPLLSLGRASDFHSINGRFLFTSVCTSPKLSFDKPRVRVSLLKSHYFQDFRQSRSRFGVSALPKNPDGASTSSDSNYNKVAILGSIVTLVLAIVNRVLYKLALVPMKEYPFFLAQLNTFG